MYPFEDFLYTKVVIPMRHLTHMFKLKDQEKITILCSVPIDKPFNCLFMRTALCSGNQYFYELVVLEN